MRFTKFSRIPNQGVPMRKVSFCVLLLWTALPFWGMASSADDSLCTDRPNPIAVHVHGVRNDHGTIKVKLYGNDPEEFLVTGKKLDAPRLPARKDLTLVCVYAPQPGIHAIVVHHDENGNRKLDRNWLGFPTEGYGFSNNPELFIGPPEHEEVAFETTEGVTKIDIEMRY